MVNKNRYSFLLQTLSDLKGLEFTLESGEAGGEEAIFLLALTGEPEPVSYRLSLLWAGSGWPSEVRQASREIAGPWPRDRVVAARSFSPGALELLRELDANWLDGAGNIRLAVSPGLFILKDVKPGRKAKPAGFAWSSSSISVAELVLSRKMSKIDLRAVAEETGWSAPQVSNVLRVFDDHGWTRRHGPPRGRGVWRELANPGALLDAWADHLMNRRSERRVGHRLMREPVRFLARDLAPLLTKYGDWAVTGWAGLELIAPYTNIVPSLQIYLPAQVFHQRLPDVFKEGEIRSVEEGGNIEFREMDQKLLVCEPDDLIAPVINLPRLYSDLIGLGGRARDGAEHLRETRIGY